MFPLTLTVAALVKRKNALGYSLASQLRPGGVHSQVCTGRDGEKGSEAASEVQAWNTKLLQSGEIPRQHLLLIPTMKAFDSWCTQRAAQPPTSPRSQTMDVLTARKNLRWNHHHPSIPAEFEAKVAEPSCVNCRFVLFCSFVRLHLRSPVLCFGLNHFSVTSRKTVYWASHSIPIERIIDDHLRKVWTQAFWGKKGTLQLFGGMQQKQQFHDRKHISKAAHADTNTLRWNI